MPLSPGDGRLVNIPLATDSCGRTLLRSTCHLQGGSM